MEREITMTQAIDRFLASSLRSATLGDALPDWPSDWLADEEIEQAVAARIAFHGIALALLRHAGRLSVWPEAVGDALRGEARGQSFWELGHREMIARLVAALAGAGIQSTIAKGTALAYSVYPEPAMRRRGDSDVLVSGASRDAVRRVLAANGFRQVGDKRLLQESWAADCAVGFTHVFDLHWQINASPVLAAALERGGIGTRTMPLPRLSGEARALAPVDNLVVVAINRGSHERFGYRSGEAKLFDQDRLIWALDVDLLCGTFAPEDWQQLLTIAIASGTAPVVLSALTFAETVLGTTIPDVTRHALACEPGDKGVLCLLGELGGLDRLKLEMTACPTLGGKLSLAAHTLFPGREVLNERFPEAAHWPAAVLHARRLLGGVGGLLGRGN